MTNETRIAAIATNLAALAALLKGAADMAAEAAEAATEGHRNLAIGTVLPLGETLATAIALQGAAVALHRQ